MLASPHLFSAAYDCALIQGQEGAWHVDKGDDDAHDHGHVNVNDHAHVRDHDDGDGDHLDRGGMPLCRNLGTSCNLRYESLGLMRPYLRHDGDGFLAANRLLLQSQVPQHDIYIKSNSYDCYLR